MNKLPAFLSPNHRLRGFYCLFYFKSCLFTFLRWLLDS
nr:MAG TPA: hypothetical protein [Caudoviricetes sp.]